MQLKMFDSTKRWSVINVWEPRYHDDVLLIKTTRVGEKNRVVIERGAFAGEYFCAGAVIKSYPIEGIKNKRGGLTNMYALPLSQLERI